MLLFSLLFSFFSFPSASLEKFPENVCWQLPSFHKSKHCDSLFLCCCDKRVCEINILNVWDNTAKPKRSAWRWQTNKYRPGKWILIVNLEVFFHFTGQIVEDFQGRKSKAGSLKRGTCHFRWSCSIWFKAVCLLFEAMNVSRRSARWTFCHWTIQYILSVKLLLSRFHTYKHKLPRVDSFLLLHAFYTHQYQLLLLWFTVFFSSISNHS